MKKLFLGALVALTSLFGLFVFAGVAHATAPTITSVSPTSGSTSVNTTVVITGTDFTGIVTGVLFGSTNASFTTNSATQITAIAPPQAASTVNVTVTTGGGTSNAVSFTYGTGTPPPTPGAPVITSLTPSTGPIATNTTVVLAGTGFSNVINVKFGGAATGFVVNSSTQITAIAPPGTGATPVTVTTILGTSAASTFTHSAGTGSALPNFGPGTSIMSDGGPPAGSWCTVAAVGYDDLNRLVALTAGHCSTRPYDHQEVFLSSNTAYGAIGTYETITTNWPGFPSTVFPADSSKDYAVILLDAAKVNPINHTPNSDQTINHIETHVPVPGTDIMCKYGQVSAVTCGLVIEFSNNTMRSWAALIPGDSGGAVTYTNSTGFAGINSSIDPTHPWAPNQFSGIWGILDDIASQGSSTVGIGFEPIP